MIAKHIIFLSIGLFILTACNRKQHNNETQATSIPIQTMNKQETPIAFSNQPKQEASNIRTISSQPNHTNKQPEKCNNLRAAKDIEDLMHQIVNNLDSHCLFTYSTQELEQIWAINPTPNIYSVMFPELNPDAPDYLDKVQNEITKVMNGTRVLDNTTAKQVEQLMRNAGNPSAISIGRGTWSSSGSNQPDRQGIFFSIKPNEAYKAKHGGFGKGFNNIQELPAFFRQNSENRIGENRYYRYNSSNNPDLPMIDIYYDKTTGNIESIDVYERKPR